MLIHKKKIKVFEHVGINKAVAYILLYRIWQILSALISVFVIAYCLSPAEQGYYYTFGSLLALQIFFELGLFHVIIQFISHEKAHLEWTPENKLRGNKDSEFRIGSLVRFFVKWYLVAGFLIIIFILPSGLFFFKSINENELVLWKSTWILLVILTGMYLISNCFFAVLEGANRVDDVATFRVKQEVIAQVLFWISLLIGFKLFALVILVLVRLIFAIYWLLKKWKIFFTDLLTRKEFTLQWGKEIFPFQWKMALSSLSGFFIFAFFNPVIFKFQGATIAGQTGMSLSIMTGISTIGMAWINARVPIFGNLIAKKDYSALNNIFFKTMAQSLIVVTLGVITFIVLVKVLSNFHYEFISRVLSPVPLFFIGAATISNQVAFIEASYLRAHKEEPFLLISLSCALAMGISTFFLSKNYGVLEVMQSYFIISFFFSVICATYIFYVKRKLWHK